MTENKRLTALVQEVARIAAEAAKKKLSETSQPQRVADTLDDVMRQAG